MCSSSRSGLRCEPLGRDMMLWSPYACLALYLTNDRSCVSLCYFKTSQESSESKALFGLPESPGKRFYLYRNRGLPWEG